MNFPESEFGARRVPKLAMNVLVLALAGALSACATKGPAGSAAGAGGAKGSAATAGTGSASQGGGAGGAGTGGSASSARSAAQAGAGGAAGGGSSDPFDGLVSRNSAGAADHLADSSVSDADGAGGSGGTGGVAGAGAADDPVAEAIRRDQAARAAAAAAGGQAAGAAGGRAGAAASDSAGNATSRDAPTRSGTASGGSHKSGADTLADGDDGAATGGDPVKRALRQAERNRQAAAAGGAGAAGEGAAGAAGAGGAGAAGSAAGSSAAGAGAGTAGGASRYADDSPVARALRQAEAAEAAARERDRLEAEARRGRVETAANSVLIDQDDRLQTLGGMLPMALNMDEQGLFDFDRYQLRDEVKKSLDEVAEKLKTAAYDKLHILGFTDRIGTEEYNRRLSEKRAWAVAGYLMNKGVPPHKLRVVGRGEEGSVVGDEQCEGLTREAMIECLQRDRRVEIAATVKEYQLEVR